MSFACFHCLVSSRNSFLLQRNRQNWWMIFVGSVNVGSVACKRWNCVSRLRKCLLFCLRFCSFVHYIYQVRPEKFAFKIHQNGGMRCKTFTNRQLRTKQSELNKQSSCHLLVSVLPAWYRFKKDNSMCAFHGLFLEACVRLYYFEAVDAASSRLSL